MTDAGPAARDLDGILSAYRPSDAIEAGQVARVRDLVVASAAAGTDPWHRELPLHATGSAVIVHPPTGRVLLRWHARQGTWLHVGGHGDPGESDPLAVAVREAMEETGLDDLRPWPDGSLLHVAVVPVPASATEPAHEHADLRFVLATQRPDAARPENATARLRWATLDDAAALTASASLKLTLGRLASRIG
jgi:8-oxo-dGTP pyrophosphatase MutT (NUDIX family)